MKPERPGTLDEFLARLRQQTQNLPKTTPLPTCPGPDLREVPPGEDLVACFAAQAAANGSDVRQVAADAWPSTVQAILREHAVRTVVLERQSETALTAQRVSELCTALEADGLCAVIQPDEETLFAADASVTGVSAAIAETGTLVCVSGSATARGTSLIPPVHVALVRAEQIVGDLFDYFDGLDLTHPPPANLNLISGPSKTADIEGILVTGVHGPGHVHVVLLD